MDFSNSQYAQLIIAILGGIFLFMMVYRLPEKKTLGFLILLIPFQIIDSRYGTLNTMLVYLVAGAYLLEGRLSRLPFLAPMLLVLFAFALSLTQSHPAARMHHLFYLIGFFGNVLMFYLVYNFLLRTKDWEFILNCLLILNVFVAIYCGIQFVSGAEQVQLFGIKEFSMNPIRRDGRLVGPFKATAATAEYFSLQCVILAFVLVNTPRRRVRNLAYALLATNALFLITTGNRGGFVTLVLGGFLFLYMFRRQLGFARIAKMVIVGGTFFTLVAVIVVNFTEYDMLFSRLEGTTVEGGVPDTRAVVWPQSWERIQEAPLLGHGPKFWISSDPHDLVADIPYMLYPHNLVLHILFTTGVVGLLAWIIFFWQMLARLLLARDVKPTQLGIGGIPRVGLVILAVIFVSQIRIEFLREGLLDYQHYLFVLFAFFLAVSDIIFRDMREEVNQRGFGKQSGKQSGNGAKQGFQA